MLTLWGCQVTTRPLADKGFLPFYPSSFCTEINSSCPFPLTWQACDRHYYGRIKAVIGRCCSTVCLRETSTEPAIISLSFHGILAVKHVVSWKLCVVNWLNLFWRSHGECIFTVEVCCSNKSMHLCWYIQCILLRGLSQRGLSVGPNRTWHVFIQMIRL